MPCDLPAHHTANLLNRPSPVYASTGFGDTGTGRPRVGAGLPGPNYLYSIYVMPSISPLASYYDIQCELEQLHNGYYYCTPNYGGAFSLMSGHLRATAGTERSYNP